MTTTPHLIRDRGTSRWSLSTPQGQHRVQIVGSLTRTTSWYVDDQLVAEKQSAQDDVHLAPGGGLEASPDATALTQSDIGRVRVKFTSLGRPKRVTWYPPQSGATAEGANAAEAPITAERVSIGTGGIDFDPEPGSPAALRAERIRRHPRRYAALALAGGIAKVGLPLLIGFFVIRWTVSIPWPDLNLPSIPWPDWDLPAIPWPDLNLPDWAAPAWVTWLVEHRRFIWPVVLAGSIASAEIRRQRQQDTLKAQLRAESVVADPSRADVRC